MKSSQNNHDYSEQEIYGVFDQLYEWGELKDSYSVVHFAEKVGVSRKQLIDWSKENEDWDYCLKMTKHSLTLNAEDAINSGIFSYVEGARYLYENDDMLLDHLREEGETIPEDLDEFHFWISQQAQKDMQYGI